MSPRSGLDGTLRVGHHGTMRVALAVVLTVALAAPAAGQAHVTGAHTGFVATVSGIDPPLPGLLVQVLGGHERLSVRNWTQASVVIFDGRGGTAARLAPGESRTWADPRVRYSGPTPKEEGLVRNWQIRGEADGKAFTIAGFLGYRPPAEAAGGGVLVVAALALPLWKRKGESV